jgi:hypothetical protein
MPRIVFPEPRRKQSIDPDGVEINGLSDLELLIP